MSNPQTNYETSQARSLIGKDADKYIEIFNNIAPGSNKAPWNWSAFALGGIWLFHRKALPSGASKIAALISIALLLFAWSGVGTVIWLAFDLIIGKNANEWLKQSIDDRLVNMPR